jgi:putative RecB family exonuclease
VETTRVSLGPRDAVTRLSPSRVSSWRSCELAFAYRHLVGLPDPSGAPAVLGRFVHAVLEALHGLPGRERTLERARALASEEKHRLATEEEYVDLALDDVTARAFRWRAWRAIEAAFRVEDPATVDCAGQEVRLDVEVDGIHVLGFADRIDRDGRGGLVVTDYKTGTTPPARFWGDKLLLMDLYALMVEQAWGDRPVAHRLLFLGDGVEVRTRVDDARCGAALETLHDTWDQVTRACDAGEFTARGSGLCATCSFRAHCPLYDGEVVLEAPPGTRRTRSLDEPLPLSV